MFSYEHAGKSLDLGKTNEEVVQALKLMQTYIENIIKNPAETKFQKVLFIPLARGRACEVCCAQIRAGNKAFTSKIACLEGAAEVRSAEEDEGGGGAANT